MSPARAGRVHRLRISDGSVCHGPNLGGVVGGPGLAVSQFLYQRLEFLDGLALRGHFAAQLVDLLLAGNVGNRRGSFVGGLRVLGLGQETRHHENDQREGNR